MSIESRQVGSVVARVYAIDALNGRNDILRTAEVFQNPNLILPANAALADTPRRIAELPYVDFHKALRLPHETLGVPLETHDCVLEIGTERLWIRGLYSPSAPVNGALRDICASVKLPPWRGEIIVIALGKKTPFKAVKPVMARDAMVKCVGLIYL